MKTPLYFEAYFKGAEDGIECRAYCDRLGDCDRIDYLSDDGWVDIADAWDNHDQQLIWQQYWSIVYEARYP